MIVDVKLENTFNLESFKKILEKYSNYKSFYRELKINSLLGKKSQFDIQDIKPVIFGGFEDDKINATTFRIKESAFSISSISFVVDKYLNVNKISLDIEILQTTHGEILSKLINFVDFRPEVIYYKEYYEVIGFVACNNSKLVS
jgi:hypothetical protein